MLKHLGLPFAAVLATTIAPSADAAILYEASGQFQVDTDNDGQTPDELFDWAFSYLSTDFISSLQEVVPTSCSISGSLYACSGTQTLDPVSYAGNGNHFLGFNYSNTDLSGGGTYFYFFGDDALTSLGDHLVSASPPPGYGSAGTALLSVSQVGGVPEPASWALMITGLGLCGAAMRRSRKAVGIPQSGSGRPAFAA